MRCKSSRSCDVTDTKPPSLRSPLRASWIIRETELLVVLVIAAGCGGVLPPVEPVEQVQIAPDPVPAKAEFYVVGSELGDADVLTRIRHRVRLKRRGRITLRPTGEAIH